jgi:replicative DNA helicase
LNQFSIEERIKSGLKGDYQGLDNGLDRINNYIFGIQRACYSLIGGASGSAKTTFLDYQIITAIQDAELKNIPLNIIYYSWEIDELTKKANWLSVLIYKKYQIVISPEKIKGLGKFRLTEDEQKLVFDEIEEVDKIFNKIIWVWEPQNPTGCYKFWWDYMSPKGKFIKEKYVDENNTEQERIVRFELNNPNEYNIVAIDHVSLAKLERGYTLKQNLDKLSEYTVLCRNLFKMTFIYLQQFNNGLSSIDRLKFKGADISPQQSDFRDSGNLYIDCDIALGLMNAYKMDMETCLNYNIRNCFDYNLKENFRMLKIVKNRLSRDNIAIGLLFLPKMGSFKELPESDLINKEWVDNNLK